MPDAGRADLITRDRPYHDSPPLPARQHSDQELTAALAPFASDYVARLRVDGERDGAAAARMLACGRLSHYYSLVLAACSDAADEWQKGRAA